MAVDGVQTWVINLDRAQERLSRIGKQLQQLGLPFQRLSAVDARQLSAEQLACLDAAAYARKHGKPPVLGELGCYLSHLQVMRGFLASAESDSAFALVLEDDAVLLPELPTVLRALVQQPTRWDMVKLSAVHSGTPKPYLQLLPGFHLAVMLSRCTGSSAYLINRKAAQRYSDGLLPMQLPYDHVFDQGWRFGLKVRLVTPTPCRHDEQIASTIVAPAGGSGKFPWYKRGSTYAYRFDNELKRVKYGLSAWWHETRG